ncbi:cytosolic carboxypeptidase 1-like isoform X2 [Periplaneta americana]|uniref:cytosolic carboxypeptidase 1-like isoform X2 n=1 Tax=Periplaneta americana TaxID=6978 RepID=UPI0037E927E1
MDENVSDVLIERLKLFAATPQESLDGFRSVAARLHSRAASHDKRMKERTLESILYKDGGILPLLIELLEVVNDQAVSCSVAGILHECVAPRAGKIRYVAISQLTSTNASQQLVKILMQHQVKDVTLSDIFMLEMIWLFAHLAQRDNKFSIKIRLIGGARTFHTVLKAYYNNSKMLYPVLLVVKCLTKNSSTASLLVKDGLVTTMEKIIVYIGFIPNSRLRLSLNVISNLTRCKIGRRSMRALDAVTLLHKFSSRCPEEKSYDHVLSRVCNIINGCLERKQLPVESVLSPATFLLPAVKIEYSSSDSSITGKHSSEHEGSPGSDDDSYEDVQQDEDDDGDDENGNEEDDDDEDNGALDEDDDEENVTRKKKIKDTTPPVPVQRELEDLIGYEHYFNEFSKYKKENSKNIMLNSPNYWDSSVQPCENIEFEHSCKERLAEKIFAETLLSQYPTIKTTINSSKSCDDDLYQEKSWQKAVVECCKSTSDINLKDIANQKITKSVSSVLSTMEAVENGVKLKSITKRSISDNSIPASGINIIAHIGRESGSRNAYATIASRVNSIIPFKKIAYPDMVGGDSLGILEPLNVKDRRVCRAKLLACVERGMNEGEVAHNVVYDLDAVLAELPPQPRSENKYRLLNLDEIHVDRKITTKTHLCFESRFESGNLRKAIQVSAREYDLILMPDVNSSRHHQWFYFEVSNMEARVPYIFNIVNCEKQNSQFNYGMKPIMYSVREALSGRPGWVRTGSDICYYKNCYQNPSSRKPRSYLTTTFTIAFKHSYDVCYIAYHYPYTYSQLMTQIWKWSHSVDAAAIFFRAESICLSLNKNETPLITLTAAESEMNSIATRDVVFLTARVHPGESNSSWVMHGTISYLLGNSDAAIRLRNKYVFKIVPMLNPEGVINGCHRCGLSNEDLNRRWSRPDPNLHPVIYHTKGLLEYCVRVLKKSPFVFCDYHGHSRRKNVFLYGCSKADSWCPTDRADPDNPHQYLLLPHLMAGSCSAFALQSCNFQVERGRESTARVTVWREFDIKKSYTMETSYCGCDQGKYEGHHVDTVRLKEVGEQFCCALSVLHDDSYWKRGVVAFGPAVLGMDSEENLGECAVEASDSDQSECSDCGEESCACV